MRCFLLQFYCKRKKEKYDRNMEFVRIEKILSEMKICSRREAKKLLKEEKIKFKGKKLKPGEKILRNEKKYIQIDPSIEKEQSNKITVAVYKPRSVTSSKDGKKNVFHIFPQFRNLHTVGRLDKESEGLLLLTNDGLVTKAVTGKNHRIEKEYIVEVRENILPWMIKKMEKGMLLEDGPTLPARAEKLKKNVFRIILKEGRKHQIRRMANALHLTVLSLKRIRIGDIKLGSLKPGHYRKLSNKEIKKIKEIGLK